MSPPGPQQTSPVRTRRLARRKAIRGTGADPRWGADPSEASDGITRPRSRSAAARRATARGARRLVRGRSAQRVRQGVTRPDGISPSMRALIERGVQLHPATARRMKGRIVIRFRESYSPVRIEINSRTIKVEDGDLRKPDVAIEGSLPDIVALAAAPQMAGIPNPVTGRGLSALRKVASGQVQLKGDTALARRLLRLLAL